MECEPWPSKNRPAPLKGASEALHLWCPPSPCPLLARSAAHAMTSTTSASRSHASQTWKFMLFHRPGNTVHTSVQTLHAMRTRFRSPPPAFSGQPGGSLLWGSATGCESFVGASEKGLRERVIPRSARGRRRRWTAGGVRAPAVCRRSNRSHDSGRGCPILAQPSTAPPSPPAQPLPSATPGPASATVSRALRAVSPARQRCRNRPFTEVFTVCAVGAVHSSARPPGAGPGPPSATP